MYGGSSSREFLVICKLFLHWQGNGILKEKLPSQKDSWKEKDPAIHFQDIKYFNAIDLNSGYWQVLNNLAKGDHRTILNTNVRNYGIGAVQ